MTKGSDNLFPKVLLDMQTSDPAAPSDRSWKLYTKANGVFARSSNSVVGPFVSASGVGSVATDTIWDAKGDSVWGTGADAASKLAVGSNSRVIQADSSQSVGAAWTALPVNAAASGDGSANVTTTSTSFVDLTGASLTVTTLARKVKLHFYCITSNSSADALNSFVVLIDAAIPQGVGSLGNTRSQEHTATVVHNVAFTFMTAPLSAGSHTFKVQWRVSAGTGTVNNGTNVWHFWVEECWS
jgi:hypothetical protein